MPKMDTAVRNKADRFRTLYDANHESIRRLLARIVGPQDAEDLAQTVFTKAANALPSFRGDAQMSTWLYRIAANAASDWLRSRPAQEAKITVELAEAPDKAASTGSVSGDGQTSPEGEIIRKEMNDCIRGVIGRLPDRHRTVLMLSELGGCSDDELAKILGIARGTAKVRLHRAREQMKEALEHRCDFYRNEDNEFACEPKAGVCEASSPRPGCSNSAKSSR
jgi:RNA polymerase sigma-70 factor, ECF subfamily